MISTKLEAFRVSACTILLSPDEVDDYVTSRADLITRRGRVKGTFNVGIIII